MDRDEQDGERKGKNGKRQIKEKIETERSRELSRARSALV